jgi:YVTN family beta-propeller protein
VANTAGSNAGSVTIIDGATNSAATIADTQANDLHAIAVNPLTGRICVANQGSNNVTVIDGATATVSATISAGTTPFALAVNPVTNKIYVANYCVVVTVINGATDTVTATLTDPNAIFPTAVALNPVTNQIYVVNSSSGNVTVIDGATVAVTATITDPNAISPFTVAVDPVTKHVYVVNQGNGDNSLGSLTAIDGATGTVSNAIDLNASLPTALVVDPVNNQIFVTNETSNNVSAFAPAPVQAIPIQTAITPLTNNQTDLLATTFNFTATNSLTAAPIDNLLFQVDTWQAPWLPGIHQTGSNFTGASPTLQPGFHTLYAYSTDGEEATGANTGPQRSGLIGSIAVYSFLVAAPEAGLSPNPAPFGAQAFGTASSAQPVTLTNSGSAPLDFTVPAMGGGNPDDF